MKSLLADRDYNVQMKDRPMPLVAPPCGAPDDFQCVLDGRVE